MRLKIFERRWKPSDILSAVLVLALVLVALWRFAVPKAQQDLVAVVTVETLNGQTPAAYASAHYQSSGYDNDGMMLLISERDGLWYLYTSGLAAEVISDEMIVKLGTQIKENLESGKYYDACKTFTKKCTNPVCEQINTNAVSDKTLEREHRTFVMLGLGGGLLLGIATVMLLGMSFRKPSKKERA